MTDYDVKEILKKIRMTMKRKKVGYSALGSAISLSESGVKKFFQGDDCSIKRLGTICDFLEISLSELIKNPNRKSMKVFDVASDQEAFLIDNLNFLHFYWELRESEGDISNIQALYNLSDQSLRKYLLKLDKVGLIELHPNNRVVIKPDNKTDWDMRSACGREMAHTIVSGVSEQLLDKLRENKGMSTSLTLAISNRKMLPDTLNDLVSEVRKIQKLFAERITKENTLADPVDLVETAVLFAVTPFRLAKALTIPNEFD